MLADYVKDFCDKSGVYQFIDDYSGRFMFGRTCCAIVVPEGHYYFAVVMELLKFLQEQSVEDSALELEGTTVDNMGLGYVIYFPKMKGV